MPAKQIPLLLLFLFYYGHYLLHAIRCDAAVADDRVESSFLLCGDLPMGKDFLDCQPKSLFAINRLTGNAEQVIEVEIGVVGKKFDKLPGIRVFPIHHIIDSGSTAGQFLDLPAEVAISPAADRAHIAAG